MATKNGHVIYIYTFKGEGNDYVKQYPALLILKRHGKGVWMQDASQAEEGKSPVSRVLETTGLKNTAFYVALIFDVLRIQHFM